MVNTSTGQHYGRRIVNEWRDGGRHNNRVAQVVMHFGVVGNNVPVASNSGYSSIVVQEIMKEPAGVPYIAHEGDKITFDSNTGDVFINGEESNDLLDFGTDFVDLVQGRNLFVLSPDNFDT